MDHIDHCIVDILQHNARLPVKEIASRVSLSSPAVCARIERLEKSGVLASYQAMINVTAIGYLVKAFINLEVEPEQKPASAEIRLCPAARAEPQRGWQKEVEKGNGKRA